MIKTTKTSQVLGAALLVASSSVCQSASQESLQDSKKAVEYFENELSFKTNPHGIKAVIDGKAKNNNRGCKVC